MAEERPNRVRKLNTYLGIAETDFEEKGILNPYIGIDSELFLDPALLKDTKIPEFSGSYRKMIARFKSVLKVLSLSKKKGDLAWRTGVKALIFKETRGVSIGYGKSRSDGGGIGPELAAKIAETAREIIDLGISDPTIFEVISLFQEDLGADRISDMAISIIVRDIAAYTQRMAKELGVDSELLINTNVEGEKFELIRHPERFGKPIFLLPNKLLRDLPLALSRDEIGHVVYFNQQLRSKVSGLIVKEAAAEINPDDVTKEQLRELLLNKSDLASIVSNYKSASVVPYDFTEDPKGEVVWSKYGKELATKEPLKISLQKPKSIEDVHSIVEAIIAQFTRSIEHNELKELLYVKKKEIWKPRHEKYAQRLFYSVADTYCNANNVMLSREPNAGNGPVDFKIGSDYDTQVLVELKLSTGQVRHGFKKQLPTYQKNENTKYSFLVILKVTKGRVQIDDILEIEKTERAAGKIVPQIREVDAMLRSSASKP